jgi:gas vesicle protein
MSHRRSGFEDGAIPGLLIFAAGALAGAAAALILAPTSGRETRTYLGRRGREFADHVAQRGRKAWNESHVAQAVREGYTSAAEAIGERVRGAKHPEGM